MIIPRGARSAAILLLSLLLSLLLLLLLLLLFVAGLCCPHARRSTQSQIRSASVKDAATISDSRTDTVLSFKCPVWKDQSCRDSGSTKPEANSKCSESVGRCKSSAERAGPLGQVFPSSEHAPSPQQVSGRRGRERWCGLRKLAPPPCQPSE